MSWLKRTVFATFSLIFLYICIYIHKARGSRSRRSRSSIPKQKGQVGSVAVGDQSKHLPLQPLPYHSTTSQRALGALLLLHVLPATAQAYYSNSAILLNTQSFCNGDQCDEARNQIIVVISDFKVSFFFYLTLRNALS